MLLKPMLLKKSSIWIASFLLLVWAGTTAITPIQQIGKELADADSWEWQMDQEQENRESRTASSPLEEVLEKMDWLHFPLFGPVDNTKNVKATPRLPDVFLDNTTPPPNFR